MSYSLCVIPSTYLDIKSEPEWSILISNNFMEIILDEFGDEEFYKLFNLPQNKAGIRYLWGVKNKKLKVKIYRNNSKIDNYKLINALKNAKYIVLPYNKGCALVGVPWIITKNKWNEYKLYNNDNISNFKKFIRKEILSTIKEFLGEEHEYYKYLLKKYAPLKPYENWKLYGNDYLKQDK